MANPWFTTSKRARELLEEMRTRLGPDRFGSLEEAWLWARMIDEQEVMAPARAFGVFDEETMRHLEQNVYYATFSKVPEGEVADDADGFEARLTRKYGNEQTSHIYRQEGTLKGIRNPATAKVIKMGRLLRMVYRERAKALFIDAVNGTEWQREWRPARKVWDENIKGRRVVIEKGPGIDTLVVLRNGETEGWVGPSALVAWARSAPTGELGLLARAMRPFTATTGAIRYVLAPGNPGFWFVQQMRNIKTFNRRFPGAQRQLRNWLAPLGLYGRYTREAGEAVRTAKRGEPNELAKEMLRRGLWISTGRDYSGGGARSDIEEWERELLRFGQSPELWGAREVPRIERFAAALRRFWGTGEDLARRGKAATYLAARDLHPEWSAAQIANAVRTFGTDPDFMQRAGGGFLIDLFRIFYNPWKEGLRAEKRAWFGTGWTQRVLKGRTGYGEQGRPGEMSVATIRTFLRRLVWWGLFATAGGMAIPRRDRRSNNCIPLTTVDGTLGKVLYLRLPLGEEERYYHALMESGIEAAMTGQWAGLEGLGQWYGGQVPGQNPMWELLWQAGMLAVGGVPYDTFRGTAVPGTDRGPAAARWGALGINTYNQTLGSMIGRVYLDTPRTMPTTDVERFLRLPIVSTTLGRWLKVSNQGYWERAEEYSRPTEELENVMRWEVERAYVAMSKGEAIPEDVAERLTHGMILTALHQSGEVLSDQDELDRRYWAYYLAVKDKAEGTAWGPEVETWLNQPTRLQKRAVLRGVLGSGR
jgi:hypothetical protein